MTRAADAPGIDTRVFKQAMRQLAAAVTVVSTLRDGNPVGLLATAVCSVSIEPPTLLACINRSARSFAAIESSGYFCINVLEETQQASARAFLSLEGSDRFTLFEWSTLATGAPAIKGAIATFDCVIDQAIPAETHMILIGRVVAVRAAADAAPLVYFDGNYRGLAAPAP